jgi:hypothetical protein
MEARPGINSRPGCCTQMSDFVPPGTKIVPGTKKWRVLLDKLNVVREIGAIFSNQVF